jgi:Nif-specific regulatory protein
MPYLNIVEGPGVGNSFEVKSEPQVIGRESSADIQLDSLLVSRRHAKVWERGGEYFIQDLESQNGTFVNGLPVDLHTLSMGDEVVIGEVLFSFSDSLVSGTGVHSALAPGAEPSEFSLFDTIQRTPEPIRRIEGLEPRWKRLPEEMRNLSVLNELSRRASLSSSMEQFLGDLIDVAMSAVKGKRGAVLVVNPRSNSLSLRASRNHDSDDPSGPTYSKTIVRYVIKRGIGILSKDPTQDERFDASTSIGEMDLQSTICVPMRVRNRILGVIHIDSFQDSLFDQSHLLLLNTIGDQAALFIDNFRLQEGQKRANLNLRHSLQSESLVIGKSRRMREIVDIVRLVAPTDSTILIRGESGTGKEVIARTIHRQSPRKDKPMIAVNCGALSPTVLESELFGHEKGSFTGAHQQRLGRFELADGGTIFLDEVSELPPELQVRLLRVLQEKEFERVGGQETIKVDVRILASTNRDLREAIRNGRFREDLYFRLKVIEMEVPPLRERMEDVPLLAQHFLQTYANEMGRPVPKLSEAALDAMMKYSWPGNIRELKNAIERAVVLTRGDTIGPGDLPLGGQDGDGLSEKEDLSHQAAEARQIRRVLRATGWNKTQAAKLLGISRATLDRKVSEYGLSRAAAFKEE